MALYSHRDDDIIAAPEDPPATMREQVKQAIEKGRQQPTTQPPSNPDRGRRQRQGPEL